MDLEIGKTGCYINDHGFTHVCDLPVEVAVAWVKRSVPYANMGGNVLAKDLTINSNYRTNAEQNGWLNKLFVIVELDDHCDWLAIYNHDGKFSLRRKS